MTATKDLKAFACQLKGEVTAYVFIVQVQAVKPYSCILLIGSWITLV